MEFSALGCLMECGEDKRPFPGLPGDGRHHPQLHSPADMTQLVHQESADPSSSRQNSLTHLASLDAINLHTLADATVANLPAVPLQSNDGKSGQNTITQASPSSSSPSGSARSSTSSPEPLGHSSAPAVGYHQSKIDTNESTAESIAATSQPAKRRKVDHACVYCRRSHMTCDSGRPCSRCVKRNIGHLCHDENKEQNQRWNPKENEVGSLMSRTVNKSDSKVSSITYGISSQGTSAPLPVDNNTSPKEWSMLNSSTNILTNLTQYQPPLFFSEHAGSEFSSLNDFLTMLEDTPMPPPTTTSPRTLETATDPLMLRASSATADVEENGVSNEDITNPLQGMIAPVTSGQTTSSISHLSATANGNLTLTTPSKPPQVPETARDKFFLTAADPADGPEHTPEERLKQVINAKLEAGLLTPFNYVKGYARLQRYMDRHMSPASRQRILKPLSIFRPAFRAIAQTLIDVDLVLVEEAFERMLLDYDRVFTSMAIPACLWRRTGEIYRGNKEFAALVEVPVEELRDGKLAIYELLSEDSAVNYWEKYGNIAFDSGQKAVLTSCTLKSRDGTRRSCCFSFTIRRDRYNIPSCIIGNFIPIHP
ncbi:hypothetical protein V1520DRAFT_286281 [Lipomyces starkeyi]|uniref:Zn(2)-C6 fungal-type domain-containing protein n=1 Tax=Lipomyces starkeyi NRRL Y-11557 TaxID=675824 RepID=A0A1E3Q986_LIPST|nr:hypothetical protein LIPSTDRAFT_268923 [Lipomyces starkeyi NRRL Y-11557]